jgi:hypothetical protein
MTLNRFVFKTHKWLAVITAIFTFLWFASSIVMVMPRGLMGRGGAGAGSGEAADWGADRDAGPSYKAVAVSVPQAITAVETTSAGGQLQVRGIDIVRLEGLLYFRIRSARRGTWFVNALDGTAMQITADMARRMVMAGGPKEENLTPAETLTAHTGDYPSGPLPVYRVSTKNGAATFIVEPETGSIRRSTALSRWRMFIVGWHTLDFLKPWIGMNGVLWLMWIMSIIGTAMTLFGFWILWIQFVQWRTARGRA